MPVPQKGSVFGSGRMLTSIPLEFGSDFDAESSAVAEEGVAFDPVYRSSIASADPSAIFRPDSSNTAREQTDRTTFASWEGALRKAGIKTVIYATGFHFDFSWIDLPIFDQHGYPRYSRGVTEMPGLYFCGLHWMQTQGSGLFYGVGEDAGYVVSHLLSR